ncbi:hypothetical protein FGO68_gene2865 [Halteria grandinella]|uniref:Uncharacterized protein n=1 Tax=Halteria grandinella TaxID=5974 RepID=A0A8J8NGS0_HALGN|nr:hypothetical protein FGO68_gene2865 [Halteria grandinella]
MIIRQKLTEFSQIIDDRGDILLCASIADQGHFLIAELIGDTMSGEEGCNWVACVIVSLGEVRKTAIGLPIEGVQSLQLEEGRGGHGAVERAATVCHQRRHIWEGCHQIRLVHVRGR